MKAIDLIETARSYYLLSNDKKSKPFLVGGRIKLEYALQNIDSDMIIATTGNKQRCIVLVDFDSDETWALTQKADMKLLRIKNKSKN